MASYIKDHWYGKQSLTRSLAFNTIASNIGLLLAISYSTNWLKAHSTVSDSTLLFCLIPLWALILTWQSVGSFRSASKRIKNYGSSANFYAALAVTLLSVVLALSSIANQMGEEIDYVQRGVDEYRPAEPTYTLELNSDDELILRGDIGYGATRQMKSLIEQNPAITQVLLESDGGLIVEARGIANLITENNLNTAVATRCYSACTIVFIAGVERKLNQHAQLGFHQYKLDSAYLPWIKPKEEQSKDLAYFEAKNVEPWFLETIYNTPHSEIWTPSKAVLLDAGVVTHQ